MLSLTDFLRKKVYLVLLIFNDNLNQPPNFLQSVTKYLGLTLVFMGSRALQEGFNCYFWEVFATIDNIFIFMGGLGTGLSFYGV